ncbi:hypothetical protein CB014_06865 [Salmonella enterica]|nr:hypothetical protein [Salmonella enterica]
MKAKFTIKNVPILREGRSEKRGEISDSVIAFMVVNGHDKIMPLTHEGNIIGRIERIRAGAKNCSGPIELRGDIVFTDFKELSALINEERLYPVAVTETSPDIQSTCLESVFFTTRDDCDFEDQQPIDLSELRDLVNCIAEKEAPKEARSDSCFNITEWNKEEYQHRAGVFMRIYNKQNSSLPFIVKSIINEEYEYIGVRENKFPERTMLTIISDFIKIKEAREIELTDFIKIYEDIHRHIKNDVNSRIMSIIFNERLTI